MDHYYVWKTAIWGGYFAASPETATPKRHWFYSPDFQLLDWMEKEAGHMSKPELAALSGDRLVKKRKTEEDVSGLATKTWWEKASRLFAFSTKICGHETNELVCCMNFIAGPIMQSLGSSWRISWRKCNRMIGRCGIVKFVYSSWNEKTIYVL